MSIYTCILYILIYIYIMVYGMIYHDTFSDPPSNSWKWSFIRAHPWYISGSLEWLPQGWVTARPDPIVVRHNEWVAESSAAISCLPSPEKLGSRGMPWVMFSWQFDAKMKNPPKRSAVSCSAWSPHATPQVLSLKRNHGGLHFASWQKQGSWKALICQKAGKNWNWKKKTC